MPDLKSSTFYSMFSDKEDFVQCFCHYDDLSLKYHYENHMCLQKILGANGWLASSIQWTKEEERDNRSCKKSHLSLITWQISKCTKWWGVPAELDVPTCVGESETYFLLFSVLNWSHHFWVVITSPVEKNPSLGI